MNDEISKRKVNHIDICLNKDIETKTSSTLLECIKLFHNALPEIDFENIDTSVQFLNHKFSSPILINAMVGGSNKSLKINETLASAAEELKIGMVVGSQRAGLFSPSLVETYSIVRKNAPNIFLASNIGASQIVRGLSKNDIKKCIDMIDANAFEIHLNPLQEVIQVGGEPFFRGLLEKIHELTTHLDIPVIVKEVGFGISKKVAIKLEKAGVSAIDISGAGGTSWAAIEHYRAENSGDKNKSEIGKIFWDWGIPTAVSLLETRNVLKIPIISSGGIRTGLDIAKSIILGASLGGISLPLLRYSIVSKDTLVEHLLKITEELKTTMFALGCVDIQALKHEEFIITGPLLEWKGNC